MSVKGEIIITANGSELEGPRLNNSSLIFEFNHKLKLPYDFSLYSSSGAKEVSVFSIVKDIDKITPQLYEIVNNGTVCDKILIKLYRIAKDTGEEEEYINYTLEKGRIISIENWMPSTKIEANEEIGHLEKLEMLSGIFRVVYLDGGIETELMFYGDN